MSLNRRLVEQMLLGTQQRFTQDSPILPDVFINYAANSPCQIDLLLTPHRGVSPGELAHIIADRLTEDQSLEQGRNRPRPSDIAAAGLTFNDSYVVVRLFFDQLIRVLLPLT